MNKKKTFILGVGAQKTGTTWLHNYLAECKNVDMGLLKEYHIWDAKFIEECKGHKVGREHVATNEAKALQYCMQNYEGFYENYFRSLLTNEVSITGDITPSYSGLNCTQFSNIKRKLVSAGFEIKVVFLMRDPFERCWSATCMQIEKALQEKGKHFSAQEANALFERNYKSSQYIVRTKYDETVNNLEIVFSENELFFGIFEELFEDENLINLSQFLNVEYTEGYKNVKQNVTSKRTAVSNKNIESCRSFYSETYKFCFERFPQTNTLWKSTN